MRVNDEYTESPLEQVYATTLGNSNDNNNNKNNDNRVNNMPDLLSVFPT